MSWLVIYLIAAFGGMIFVFAAFKIGSDADTAAPALQPGDQVGPVELGTGIVPLADCSSYSSSKLAPDEVVESGSAENRVRGATWP